MNYSELKFMNESIFLYYICDANDDIHLEHSGEVFSPRMCGCA